MISAETIVEFHGVAGEIQYSWLTDKCVTWISVYGGLSLQKL